MDNDVMMEDVTVKCEEVSPEFDPLYIEVDEIHNEGPKVYTKFKDADLPGYKFLTVDEVFNFISQFEKHTGQKYWKRSTRTIQGANVKRQINQDLYYYEIKYACIHGGLAFKSRSKGIRKTSSHKIGCPSHITFLASDNGQYLRIRSFNLNHESHFALSTNKKLPGEESDSEQETDDWDDSALIKAYDKAINMAKEEVSKRINEETQPSQKRTKPSQSKQPTAAERAGSSASASSVRWRVGDSCRSMYSEDGQIYEAIIRDIDRDSDTCTVEYLGYANSESVEISSLMKSGGPESCKAQIEASKTWAESQETQCNGAIRDVGYESQRSAKPSSSLSFDPFSVMDMPPAPPLPPQLMAKLPENDTDALSSMLMSWYVSGFHTGYYHGLKHARENKNQSKR